MITIPATHGHQDRRAMLEARAQAYTTTRAFFHERNVLEVDVPVLQGGANLDHGVHPFRLDVGGQERYLPTSPEHPLKRLVAAGHGALWSLAPAFRRGERGRRHAPEFRMLEWYRPGLDHRQLAEEAADLLDRLCGSRPRQRLSWIAAFRDHAGLDIERASVADLQRRIGTAEAAAIGEREVLVDLLLVDQVEPRLGRGCWTILADYPSAAAAQARMVEDACGRTVAARFEIYAEGLELANGYWELTDAAALRRRLVAEQARRSDPPALDERFLAAMAAGLPDCAGVAMGFDRILMIATGVDDIALTQAIPWDQA